METILPMILSSIWVALELWGLLYFVGAFLPVNYRTERKMIYVYGLLAWIIIMLYANLPINDLLSQFLTFVVWYAFSQMIYRGKIIHEMLLVLLYYVFAAVADVGLSYGMSLLLGITFAEYVWRIWTFITVTTVGKLLLVLVSWVLFQFRKNNDISQFSGRYVLMILLYPLISVVMLLVLFYTSKEDADVSGAVVIFSVVLIIANIGIMYIVRTIVKSEKQAHELGLLKQQIELQTQNYSTLEVAYSQQRRSSHEFQRHIDMIMGLLEVNDNRTALAYVHDLQNDRSLKVFCIRSNNPVVDVILNQKYQLAREKNIRMDVQVNDLSSIPVESSDLVVLLSNIFDNAIEACEQLSSSREILCRILYDDSLYISVRNTSLPANIDGDCIYTTKDNVREHGYGIPAITYILNKLKAEYTFAYEDGWFQFAAEV